jgi:O-antigen ligase
MLALGSASAAGVVAVLGLGFSVSVLDRAYAAPYLMALTPLGFWHPRIGGIQAPALESAAIGCAVACLPHVLRQLRRRRLGAAELTFAVLVICILLSGLGPTPAGLWAHRFLFWGSLAVVFAASVETLREVAHRRLFLLAAGTAAFAEAIVALVQYVQGSAGRFSRLGGAIVYPQPKGTLEHPNSLALYLAVSALLMAGVALAERRRRRVAAATAAIVTALGSLVPFSRGGWIALAAGVVVWGAAQRRPGRLLAICAILLAVPAVAVAAGGTFGARLSSLASRRFDDLYGFRWELAKDAVRIAAHHPLTGTGVFNEVGVYAGRPTLATHPHDLVLGVAVFFGIPAAVAFVTLLALAIRSSWRALAAATRTHRAEAAGALGALAVLVVDGLFEYPYWNLALTVQTMGLFAYAVALGRMEPRTAESG